MAKTRKRNIILFICAFIAAFLIGFFWLAPILGSDISEWPEVNPEEIEMVYTSNITEEECNFCGTLLNLHRGEDNLGIFSMHEAFVSPIQINRYDDWGRLSKKADSGFGTNINFAGESGLMTSVSADSNRGYATADISLGKDRDLDIDLAAQRYCTLCLNRIMSARSFGDPYSVGMINYKTGEVRLFSETIRGFMLGDYYVSCEPYAEGNSEEITDIDLLIFYCPERYE